jgi:hypothetical protein
MRTAGEGKARREAVHRNGNIHPGHLPEFSQANWKNSERFKHGNVRWTAEHWFAELTEKGKHAKEAGRTGKLVGNCTAAPTAFAFFSVSGWGDDVSTRGQTNAKKKSAEVDDDSCETPWH